ncbi:conjugal transfer pilus assembly protein TraV [Azotobacter beijerinckii]|uniref:Conjugal transfer pilus assembly protein TraV n=1 Tax=Azotobacter beijerinckii TaxID=170623 RepID=A0A1H9SSE0_9GAMM|nr:type IV conjugative transfer system lipoprotein TraV [Azotobacter beijerinckii]SER87932.1 conjugal transfer pilus assembly protein TraV [Azotobacter beijerinckii]
MIQKKIFTLLALVGAITGCSSLKIGEEEYSCKGMPEGATCMSAREVYAATDGGAYKTQLRQEQDKGSTKKGKDKKKEGKEGEPETRVLFAEGADNTPLPMRVRSPLPIRSQAVVMRIAVDPWEDDNGDLYVPGFVYTEIEPRRWEIGTRNPQVIPSLRPLTVQK